MEAGGDANDEAVGVLFGHTAILRSLVLFNALFAVQTLSDAAYLWGGVALPAGMSYASMHRGAYPLIVTAAGRHLRACRNAARHHRRASRVVVRCSLYLWIGQNVMLVMSSMQLDLYVDVYALTRWRCAAFVWMLLVAIGRPDRRPGSPSIAQPLAGLARARGARGLTLYVCSFVDFAAVIADFNVAHSQDVSGVGCQPDIAYLCDLGPAAIPALDALAATGQVSTWRISDGLPRSSASRWHGRAADWRAGRFAPIGSNVASTGARGRPGKMIERSADQRTRWRIAYLSSTTTLISVTSSASLSKRPA